MFTAVNYSYVLLFTAGFKKKKKWQSLGLHVTAKSWYLMHDMVTWKNILNPTRHNREFSYPTILYFPLGRFL